MSAETATHPDVATVQAGYAAFGRGDMPALVALFAPDVTWERGDSDRFAPAYHGVEAVLGYFAESAALSAGTLKVEPQIYTTDGQGHVVVVSRTRATRPDGRTLEGRDVNVFTVKDGRVAQVQQFVGKSAASAAFWA